MNTVELIDQLVDLGFTNEAFKKLHHWGDRSSITAHRSHAASTHDFHPNGNNSRVEQRLELVLNTYVNGGFRNPAVFPLLAEAAATEVPLEAV